MYREARRVTLKRIKSEAMNHDARSFNRHLFACARELVRGHAADLLCRVGRRHLVDNSVKTLGERTQLLKCQRKRSRRRLRLTLSVEGIGRKAKSDRARVVLVRIGKELREPRVLSEKQRKHTGSHRIQRSKVTNTALTRGSTHNRNHIVRGHPCWLVDDEEPVHTTIV